MATSFGSMEPFDIKSDEWNEYTERMEQYFIANAITEDKKQIAVFLTLIGGNTYSLLRNLIAPEKPSSKALNELVMILKKHFNPKPILIAQRYKFYERCQKEDESLAEYMAALRKLTEHCKFDNFLEQAIRDKYVCGIKYQNIRKRLLAERNLDLQKAIDHSKSLEEVEKQNVFITRNREINMQQIEVVKTMKNNRSPTQRLCYRCNADNHLANVCNFKDTICNYCGIKGI